MLAIIVKGDTKRIRELLNNIMSVKGVPVTRPMLLEVKEAQLKSLVNLITALRYSSFSISDDVAGDIYSTINDPAYMPNTMQASDRIINGIQVIGLIAMIPACLWFDGGLMHISQNTLRQDIIPATQAIRNPMSKWQALTSINDAISKYSLINTLNNDMPANDKMDIPNTIPIPLYNLPNPLRSLILLDPAALISTLAERKASRLLV